MGHEIGTLLSQPLQAPPAKLCKSLGGDGWVGRRALLALVAMGSRGINSLKRYNDVPFRWGDEGGLFYLGVTTGKINLSVCSCSLS